MPVRIGVCDDAPEDAALLSDALHTYDPHLEIAVFPSGEALLRALETDAPAPDLLFLDVFMPGPDGIETARRIRETRGDIRIVFLTSSADHYPQAYEVFAFNYLVKPVDQNRLRAVMDRALAELGREADQRLSFSYKSALYSVNCRDICYVESRDKLLYLYLADGKALQRRGRLEDLLNELPETGFIRCHQSFLVNLARVTEMGEEGFRVGRSLIGISKKYRVTAREQYYAYLFAHMEGGASR